jgi:hypothetical protein
VVEPVKEHVCLALPWLGLLLWLPRNEKRRGLLMPAPLLVKVFLALFFAGRCGLVQLLGAVDRLLWVELNRRAEVVKLEVELVNKI